MEITTIQVPISRWLVEEETHMHTVEYYWAIKKNEILIFTVFIYPFTSTWIERDHDTKWSKPDREKQILHDITYMQKRCKKLNLYTKEKQIHRHRKQTYGYHSGKGNREIN